VFIQASEVPPVQISLREVAKNLLIWVAKGTIGVLAIHCVRLTGVNVKKYGRLCNSKCHNSGVCGNK